MLSCQWTSFTVVPGPFIMSPYFLELPYFPRALDPFIVESYLEMEICMLVVLPANRFYYFLGAKKKKKARKYTLHNTYTHTQTHIYSKISCSSPNSELFFFLLSLFHLHLPSAVRTLIPNVNMFTYFLCSTVHTRKVSELLYCYKIQIY